MQELGLVQYTQPSDLKCSYPDILMIEVIKAGHPANGAFLVTKAKDIPTIVHRYRTDPTLPSYSYPKALSELGIAESETRYWIPTRVKIYEEVVRIVRDNNKLLNRLSNVSSNTEMLIKPKLRRMSGERGPDTTPCIGICSTTNCGDIICRGCGRTAEQVINWNTYTPATKITINSKLKSLA